MVKLFRYLKNYKIESILGPLGKFLEAIFELIVPIVMANIIDIGIKIPISRTSTVCAACW